MWAAKLILDAQEKKREKIPCFQREIACYCNLCKDTIRIRDSKGKKSSDVKLNSPQSCNCKRGLFCANFTGEKICARFNALNRFFPFFRGPTAHNFSCSLASINPWSKLSTHPKYTHTHTWACVRVLAEKKLRRKDVLVNCTIKLAMKIIFFVFFFRGSIWPLFYLWRCHAKNFFFKDVRAIFCCRCFLVFTFFCMMAFLKVWLTAWISPKKETADVWRTSWRAAQKKRKSWKKMHEN